MGIRNPNVGALVNWWHVPRGGYGFVGTVPGVVVKVGKKRVTIAVRTSGGAIVRRAVDPINLHEITSDINLDMAKIIRAGMRKGGGA